MSKVYVRCSERPQGLIVRPAPFEVLVDDPDFLFSREPPDPLLDLRQRVGGVAVQEMAATSRSSASSG